jgi:protein SMG6
MNQPSLVSLPVPGFLPIWSSTAQLQRSQPDARAPELFVLLHGMLFTNIQLDDFLPTLAHFLEHIEIEGAKEREWIMMAVMNISAVLEYARPGCKSCQKVSCCVRIP